VPGPRVAAKISPPKATEKRLKRWGSSQQREGWVNVISLGRALLLQLIQRADGGASPRVKYSNQCK
jgi:hypothetical protein